MCEQSHALCAGRGRRSNAGRRRLTVTQRAVPSVAARESICRAVLRDTCIRSHQNQSGGSLFAPENREKSIGIWPNSAAPVRCDSPLFSLEFRLVHEARFLAWKTGFSRFFRPGVGQLSTDGNDTGERIRPLDIQDEMRNSYLTYAMSVIVSRALPDARDGLNPSQRRIRV